MIVFVATAIADGVPAVDICRDETALRVARAAQLTSIQKFIYDAVLPPNLGEAFDVIPSTNPSIRDAGLPDTGEVCLVAPT